MHRVTLDVDGQHQHLVLRSDPAVRQALAETDREREWAVLQTLHQLGQIATPVPRWFDGGGEIISTPALLVGYAKGTPWSQLASNAADPVLPARDHRDPIGQSGV